MTQTIADPLLGPKLKIERAKKHVHELIAEIKAFGAKQPYRVVTDKHPRTGDVTYRLRIVHEIPSSWATIIGDIVHNLRAALDLLVCALVVHNGNQVKLGNGFPIAGSAKTFEAMLDRKVDGTSDEVKRFVKRLKPYETGNRPLWAIHELDVLDKHKAIVPTTSAYRHFTLRGEIKVPWQDEPVKLPGINIRPNDARRLMTNDGDILMRVRSPAVSSEDKYEFAFEVAFGKTQIVDGQPVVPTLQQFGQLVERIVQIAGKRLV
jgi:hypothetical protein